jgi:hypothetical protein
MPDIRENRVFKLERKDIRFPIWRKKVDGSIFHEKMITIPNAFSDFWKIKKRFQSVTKVKDLRSDVPIYFEGKEYDGHITGHKTRPNLFRISYGKELKNKLKETYAMTFMRDLEFKSGNYANDESRENIEDVIPFWEFLDIEYDRKLNKMYFTCHFRQKPHFSHLFKKIVDSTILQSIELELEGKEKRIASGGWKKRGELKNSLDAKNAIYYLLDEPNKELYVGKTQTIKLRLKGDRAEIPSWTHFRYDVLPDALEPYLEEIELMIISAFMHLCSCDAFQGSPILISDFTLKNKKHISAK